MPGLTFFYIFLEYPPNSRGERFCGGEKFFAPTTENF